MGLSDLLSYGLLIRFTVFGIIFFLVKQCNHKMVGSYQNNHSSFIFISLCPAIKVCHILRVFLFGSGGQPRTVAVLCIVWIRVL